MTGGKYLKWPIIFELYFFNFFIAFLVGKLNWFANICLKILLDKFLSHIDNLLDIILKAYRLRLFTVSTEKYREVLKTQQTHRNSYWLYTRELWGSSVTGAEGTTRASHCRLEKGDTKKFTESIGGNSTQKKLVAGMKDVWRESMNHKGRLLIVEKNCMYAAHHGIIYKTTEPYN